jgi:hypothetical protein
MSNVTCKVINCSSPAHSRKALKAALSTIVPFRSRLYLGLDSHFVQTDNHSVTTGRLDTLMRPMVMKTSITSQGVNSSMAWISRLSRRGKLFRRSGCKSRDNHVACIRGSRLLM